MTGRPGGGLMLNLRSSGAGTNDFLRRSGLQLQVSGSDWRDKLRLSLSVDLMRNSFEVTNNGTLRLNGFEINKYGIRRSGTSLMHTIILISTIMISTIITIIIMFLYFLCKYVT